MWLFHRVTKKWTLMYSPGITFQALWVSPTMTPPHMAGALLHAGAGASPWRLGRRSPGWSLVQANPFKRPICRPSSGALARLASVASS